MNNVSAFFVTEKIHLEHTFENGQCFRWRQITSDHYVGVVEGMVLEVRQVDDGTLLAPMDASLFQERFRQYFGFGQRLLERQDALREKDKWLKTAVEYCRGMTLLKQDPWETLVTFILSQNNHMARIRSLVEILARLRGQMLPYMGEDPDLKKEIFYSFPTPKELYGVREEELRALAFGYRAKYVVDAVQKVLTGEVDLKRLSALSIDEAREELKKIRGVGNKVADCVLLFGYGFQEAFPIDVWVNRALMTFYSEEIQEAGSQERFIKEYFQEEAGLAQQMLFHTLRNGGYKC